MTKGEEDLWANQIFDRMEEKLYRSLKRNGTKMLYTIDEKGHGEDRFSERTSCWVNGFWPGILWQLYEDGKESHKEEYRIQAQEMEKLLDQALFATNEGFEGLHHDVRFMWLPTAVADYRLTKNQDSRRRGS